MVTIALYDIAERTNQKRSAVRVNLEIWVLALRLKRTPRFSGGSTTVPNVWRGGILVQSGAGARHPTHVRGGISRQAGYPALEPLWVNGLPTS
jgi:hypothetical protein